VQTYYDKECHLLVNERNIYQNVSGCTNGIQGSTQSHEVFCSLGSKIPVNVASILLALHTNDSYCYGNSNEFLTIGTDVCATDLSPIGNVSIPVESLKAQCTNTGFTVSGYPLSTDCTGTVFQKEFAHSCRVVEDTQLKFYIGSNSSVATSCISFSSVSPTRRPTLRPSVVPTVQPTANYVFFSASQTITGLNYSTYMSNQSAYSLTLTSSIAACMTGILPQNIQDLVVTSAAVPPPATTRKLSSSGNNHLRKLFLSLTITTTSTSDTAAIQATYTVATTETGVTYTSLTNQLNANIANGVFTSNLNTYSQLYRTPGFINATSTPVSTTDNLSNDDDGNDSNGLKGGVIAGIVVGAFAGGFALCALSYWFYYQRSKRIPKLTPLSYPKISVDNPAVKASEMTAAGSSAPPASAEAVSNNNYGNNNSQYETTHNILLTASAITALPLDDSMTSRPTSTKLTEHFIQDDDHHQEVQKAVPVVNDSK
jgi:hypothetical protein